MAQGNYVEVFKVTFYGSVTCPLQEGKLAQLELVIRAETNFAIDQTSVYVDASTGQDALDDNGKFILGSFEDSTGDLTREQAWVDFDFQIT